MSESVYVVKLLGLLMADTCCEECGAEVKDLKRCGRCYVAKYCTRECQIANWQKGGHKQSCPGNYDQCRR